MAFSKIVGFDVSPARRPRRGLEVAETSSPRRRLSYQMLCPRRRVAARRPVPRRHPHGPVQLGRSLCWSTSALRSPSRRRSEPDARSASQSDRRCKAYARRGDGFRPGAAALMLGPPVSHARADQAPRGTRFLLLVQPVAASSRSPGRRRGGQARRPAAVVGELAADRARADGLRALFRAPRGVFPPTPESFHLLDASAPSA